jgi:hypothetical protein
MLNGDIASLLISAAILKSQGLVFTDRNNSIEIAKPELRTLEILNYGNWFIAHLSRFSNPADLLGPFAIATIAEVKAQTVGASFD